MSELLTFDVAGPAELLLAENPASDSTPASRTLAGLAVPYGVVGRTSVGPTRFVAGALDGPAAGTPLVRGHDERAVVGVVRTSDAADDGVRVVARVSATGPGNDLLALAADGAVSGFSVGVEPLESAWVEDADHGSVLNVTAARWRHLSVETFPAFAAARIDQVHAAAIPARPTTTEVPTVTEPAVIDSPAPLVAAEVAPPVLVPVAPPPPAAVHAASSLDALAGFIAANRMDGAVIRAALTNVTTTQGAGLVQPGYVDEMAGLIAYGRPAVEAFAGPRNITGNPIKHPRWKTLGLVDVQATEKTQIASGPAEVEWVDLPVPTFAGGNDVSMQLIDWGRPDTIATYLAMMTQVYARKTEAAFEAVLIAGATAGTSTETGVLDLIGGAIGQVAAVAAPDLILASGDVYGQLWATLAAIGPGLFSAVNGGFPTPRVVLLPFAAPGTLLVASSQAAVTYENTAAPVQLRVVDVSLLGVDLGVYGYFASAVNVPGAIVAVTLPAPVGTGTGSARTGSSK